MAGAALVYAAGRQFAAKYHVALVLGSCRRMYTLCGTSRTNPHKSRLATEGSMSELARIRQRDNIA